MTGMELYRIWQQAMEVQGIGVDEWEELSESYRAAWSDAANEVVPA